MRKILMQSMIECNVFVRISFRKQVFQLLLFFSVDSRSNFDILGQIAVRAQRHAVVRPFSDDGWPRAACYSVYHFGTRAVFVNELVVKVATS